MPASPEQKEEELKGLIKAWLAQGARRESNESINSGLDRRYGFSAQSGPSGLGFGGSK